MSNLRANQFSIAHPSYQVRRDALGIGECFKHDHVARQIGFMHPAKDPQERAQCCPPTFTGVAMHFASSIAIIVAWPFVIAVAHGAMHQMHVVIPRPLISIEHGASGWHIRRHHSPARLFDSLVAGDGANRARIATDHAEDGWAVVCERAMAPLLVDPPAQWVCRVGVAITFPPYVLIEFIRFKRRACQKFLWGGLVHVVLHALAQRMHRLTGEVSSRASRAVGSPFAIPRRMRTSVNGDCWVLAKAVPVNIVE